ncbi:UBX domain-containing protein 11 isoform X2 [Corythoichthys intestinalis]|uniref:UBX domain-containing protein 11 isoform X2 n=1 Tax=Corythoichthys intestinalis TaxID=161448 RepID=UPI0025A661F1|nr:UBX domain-containing protein 11 isoform X2 [Corythoichthys intestinalis]
MSSPLTMLKKMRRAPLPYEESTKRGQQENLSTESQVLCETRGPIACSPTRPNDEFVMYKVSKKGDAPSDFELMSSMMQRLTLLERQVTSQKEEMGRKDNAISVLKDKLKALEDLENGHVEICGHLERRCKELQLQVDDMERFLNDYGLIWVGDSKPANGTQRTDLGTNNLLSNLKGLLICKFNLLSDTSLHRNFHIDFDLVIQTIKELNILAGEPFIQSTPTGAHLARNDPVQLKLYSNGIVMFDGPFRSYQENSTQQCMQDLMEGYFPSELQGRFPDGVPFEVHDRRNEEFVPRAPFDKFPGKGQAVQDKKEDSAMRVSSELTGKTFSTNKFLNRLPKMVVKAGRVIDISDSVQTNLKSSSDIHNSCSAVIVNTPALQAMKDSISTDWPSSVRNMVTLKVKSEDGDCTFVLKMCLSETVGNLRKHLDTHRGHKLSGYDIISAYPPCHYQDEHQTLGSCGFTNNVTLLLRGRKNHS